MRYDLNLLPIFTALMDERSVTRAANRLTELRNFVEFLVEPRRARRITG